MIISTNITAMITNSHLSKTEDKLRGSLERLSSGYKINSSKDDSVGKALSEKMKVQIRGLDRAGQNSADGISVVETAEGALNEITSMIQRIRELAVQGSSESYGDEDREKIAQEVEALKEEINRIAKDTEFNKKSLLNGDLARRAYSLDDDGKMIAGMNIIYTSGQVSAATYTLNVDEGGNTDFKYDAGGNKVGFTNQAEISHDGNRYVITDANDFTMIFTLDTSKVNDMDVNMEVWDMGTMTIQMGANEGQTMKISIPEISTDVLGLTNTDFSTQEGCSAAVDAAEGALTFVLRVRGEIGANQNRLEYAVSSTQVSEENLTAALSRIIDVDMAEEMTLYTQYTVLQQAGISMLSQANQMPEKVLQLLQ